MALNQAYYTQEVEKPAVLEPFTNIQPQVDPLNSMRMTNLVSAAEEQAKQAITGVRYVPLLLESPNTLHTQHGLNLGTTSCHD